MFTWPVAYFVSEWVIRLVMLVYVPQRRTPAAARSWLLLMFVLPWPGLVLYAIFGRPYVPRKRLDTRLKFSELVRTTGKKLFAPYVARPELPGPFEHVVTLAQNLGDFPIMGGNQVELISNYQGAIDRLIADIGAAQRHVHLLYYIFADDAVAGPVCDALAAAAARGVSCRVLFDHMGSKRWRRRLVPRLRHAGVEVTPLLPFHWWRPLRTRLDLRNHRKIAVIDGRIGYVGSQNLVSPEFKPGIVYYELVARITGPAVLQLQAVLLADRYLETQNTLDDSSRFPAPDMAGLSAAQALPSGPSYPQANNQRLIVSLIHAAQKRVVITTPYFIPDEALLEALQTAVLRGVEVHLIVSRQADQFLVGFAQRSYYEDLLEGGLRVHQFHAGFLHAKHVSVDDAIVVIGSSNFDIRSFMLNAEISLIVYDPQVALALRAIQEETMSQADHLTLDEWRRRSFLTKTVQNLARLVDSLL